MKLHRLEIQAFGPFANKEIIEFEKLGKNPLFLIDGLTGAGKSSILHAISYALYGVTTDADRKDLGLRCDNSDKNTLTELSLEFSIKEARYRISRIPTQLRPKKNGDEYTEQKASAHLLRIHADGVEETLVPKKKKDADAKIKDIVGLTSDQFLQVMVLPQGKFRELLLAKSDDRQEILSTLFQTQIYKKIEQILKDKALGIDNENKKYEDRIKDALLDHNVKEIEDLEKIEKDYREQFKIIEQEKIVSEKERTKASNNVVSAKELEKTFRSLDEKKSSLENHKKLSPSILELEIKTKKASEAERLETTWSKLEEKSKDLKIEEANIIKINKEATDNDTLLENSTSILASASDALKIRDSLKLEENKYDSYKKQLKELSPLEEKLNKTVNIYQSQINLKNDLVKKEDKIKLSKDDIEIKLKDALNIIKMKSQITSEEIKAKHSYEDRVILEKEKKTYNSLNTECFKFENELKNAKAIQKDAEAKADQLEYTWFSNQAAFLASKLEDDKPCLVCGSIDHPAPTPLSEELSTITKENIDLARADQSNKVKATNNLEQNIIKVKSSLVEKEKTIKCLEVKLENNLDTPINEVKNNYNILSTKLKEIEKTEKTLETLENKKIQIEREYSDQIAKIKKSDLEIQKYLIEKTTADSVYKSAYDQLPDEYRDITLIEKKISLIQAEITKIEAVHEKATKNHTANLTKRSSLEAQAKVSAKTIVDLEIATKSLSSTWDNALEKSNFSSLQDFQESRKNIKLIEEQKKTIESYKDKLKKLDNEINLLKKQLDEKERPNLEKANHILESLTEDFSKKEENWTKSQQLLKSYESTLKKIENIKGQQKKIKEQFDIVGILSRAASGKGNIRVTLERFVLGSILDQVLSIASQRLNIMSKGQYRIIRQNEETQKKNTTAGLDLAIDDAYTGKIRPVATLSGGESFMASLALALGLSDVVQERSGGVQLDTLFIDEGFGSLDQESLQLAIDILIDLQSSGRSIGIISHVSELKEQMAKRIEVKSTRLGSSVRVMV